MKVFPFVLYHQLESVDPCFEGSNEAFFSDFVDKVGITLLSSAGEGCRIW
jgi:hypothetical protein